MAEKQLANSMGEKKEVTSGASNEKKGSRSSARVKEPVAGTSGSSHSNAKSTKSRDNDGANGDQILTLLQSIQTTLVQQDERMEGLTNRIDNFESGVDYEYEYGEEGELPPENEGDSAPSTSTTNDVEKSGEKRKDSSRFESMAKKFRSVDYTDKPIDDTLATNITDLFRNGIDDDRYSELIKDELNARPSNCEGLSVVKTNRLIWDAVSHNARINDKKLQNVACSVVKAATILAKSVNGMASLEKENDNITPVIDDCNKVLALLGHTNRQVNLARRDLLKPKLRDEYSHLCMHSLPFTTELFGDDVGKKAKEIEDCNKIGNRILRGGYGYRGPLRGRSGMRFRGRGRARGTPGYRGRPYGQNYGGSASGQHYGATAAKNEMRRGYRPTKQ